MGIVLRMSGAEFSAVDTYYARSKREPTKRGDLEIGSVTAFKPDFMSLVAMLDAKQQSHVVIVCHGTDSGFTMPMTAQTDVSANNKALVDLLGMVDQAPSVNASDRSSFATYCAITEAEVDALVALCLKVRKHESNCFAVHVRGCKFGKSEDNLKTLRRLFNSAVVSAPTVPMLYTPLEPDWHTHPDLDVDKWTRDNKPATRRRELTDSAKGKSRFVLDVEYAGVKASAVGAIQKIADLPHYATQIYGHAQHGVSRAMTLAAMWTDKSYALPHEQAYIDSLAAVRAA